MDKQPDEMPTGDTLRTLIKSEIANRLLNEISPDLEDQSVLYRQGSAIIRSVIADTQFGISDNEQEHWATRLITEILGLGPLETVMADDTVSEVIIVGPSHIYAIRQNQLELTNVVFESESHILRILDKMVWQHPEINLRTTTLPPVLYLPCDHYTIMIICPPSANVPVPIIYIVKK